MTVILGGLHANYLNESAKVVTMKTTEDGQQLSLLEFSRSLLLAEDVDHILEAVLREVCDHLGYQTVWLYLLDNPGDAEARLWMMRGALEAAPQLPHRVPISGDAMIAEILASTDPVLIEDARTDPRVNPEIVSILDNRTIVNVRIQLVDGRVGCLGTGSFGDEGVKVPSPSGLASITTAARLAAVAIDRLRVQEEHQQLSHQLLEAHRLEAMGRLAGAIAHDFGNLLQSISNCATLLTKLDATEEQKELAEVIRGSVARGAALTEQILGFARDRPRRREELDLGQLVESLRPMIVRLLGKRIRYTTDHDPDTGTILADRGRLEQVLLNLILNARDAIEGKGEITVRTYEDDGHMCFDVRDTGTGVPTESLAQVFDPYYTTKSAGHGIGLATCRGIIEHLGGTIEFESDPGQGTTVTTRIPA